MCGVVVLDDLSKFSDPGERLLEVTSEFVDLGVLSETGVFDEGNTSIETVDG